MKDIVYELIPEKKRLNIRSKITTQCFGEQNSQKWEYDQNSIPLLWEKVKDHHEINQRELLTTESSSTLTESLNGKNDIVDNSTIEMENDLTYVLLNLL